MGNSEVCEKKNVARDNSFTTLEDEALTKAWIRILEDAIVGSDQRGDVFFKVFDDYYESIKPAYCPKILAECFQFAGCVAKLTNARPIGTNNNDVLHLATALLNKLHITSVSKSCGLPFKFVSCWHFLKNHPKLDLMLNPPAPPTDTSMQQDEHEDEISERIEKF